MYSHSEDEDKMFKKMRKKKFNSFYAITYRQNLRRLLIKFWNKLDKDNQENAKREWARILEQTLYRKRSALAFFLIKEVLAK